MSKWCHSSGNAFKCICVCLWNGIENDWNKWTTKWEKESERANKKMVKLFKQQQRWLYFLCVDAQRAREVHKKVKIKYARCAKNGENKLALEKCARRECTWWMQQANKLLLLCKCIHGNKCKRFIYLARSLCESWTSIWINLNSPSVHRAFYCFHLFS